MRFPLTVCGFHLHVADSATAQFDYTRVLLFVCGLHKLIWIPQIRLRVLQNCMFLERFLERKKIAVIWIPRQI